MNFLKKLFGSKSNTEAKLEKNIKINKDDAQVSHNEIPWMTDLRLKSLRICNDAGFTPAKSLPTDLGRELRPSKEIAGRLHAIKALVLWLMVPSDDLPNEKILIFVDKNELKRFMTADEVNILSSSRDDMELRNAIGWKFENAWPLAWYFGYIEPEITGQMMLGEQMQDILINYTCTIDELVDEWIAKQEIIQEETITKKEDLFYCLHNAVRSAQLGKETVPNGFDPIGNGGVIHERRHSLTWMLSKGVEWENTDLST